MTPVAPSTERSPPQHLLESAEGSPAAPWLGPALLVSADSSEVEMIEQALLRSAEQRRLVRVKRLAEATERLGRERFALVLLDLRLPDAQGIDAFGQVFLAARDAAIVLLSSPADEMLARQAVQLGADGYFLKRSLHPTAWHRELGCIVERKAALNALHLSELCYRTICEAHPQGVLAVDDAGLCLFGNSAFLAMSGLSPQELKGTAWMTLVHPDDRRRVLDAWSASRPATASLEIEFRLWRADAAAPAWVRVRAMPMIEHGVARGHTLLAEDIGDPENDFLRAGDARLDENERARAMLASIGEAVIATDLAGRVNYMNRAAEQMTGWSRAEAAGQPLGEVFRLVEGDSGQPVEHPVDRALQGKRIGHLAANGVLVGRSGDETPIDASAAPIHGLECNTIGVVIVFHDVSESHAMTLKMSHLAQHDFLTGLPNRVLLTDRLTQAIGLAHRQGKQIALMYLDLDFFKHINDTLGHAVGDQLLQAVARRLTTCVRHTDTVCRQGGDEFVILLAELEDPQHAAHVAEKLLASLTAPQLIDGHEIHITLSIGISIYPDDGRDVATIMQNADTAMYYAKEGGRNNYQFFRADMNTRAVQRMLVENALRRALKEQEFVLHYQPEFDLGSGAVTGIEALLRWIDPKLGMIYPEQFVPIAEECGLIVPLGEWSLREACRQAQAWVNAGLLRVPLAINVSGTHFRQKDFLQKVARILDETGLTPSQLELEFTESTLMRDPERSASLLRSLKSMGVRLAIDDFGTGYSSLGQLRRLPIDTLKIDRSFVGRIAADSDDATIVTAVIGIGRNLHQRVVAEGVESPEQLAFLKAQHCDGGQGFHLSRPLSADALTRYLAERS